MNWIFRGWCLVSKVFRDQLGMTIDPHIDNTHIETVISPNIKREDFVTCFIAVLNLLKQELKMLVFQYIFGTERNGNNCKNFRKLLKCFSQKSDGI